jgi:hypothetical protein
VAKAQMAAFAEWEQFKGERFPHLKNIRQPTLIVNGTHDEMIPVRNSYWLSEAHCGRIAKNPPIGMDD